MIDGIAVTGQDGPVLDEDLGGRARERRSMVDVHDGTNAEGLNITPTALVLRGTDRR
jgi:hypothetical protein